MKGKNEFVIGTAFMVSVVLMLTGAIWTEAEWLERNLCDQSFLCFIVGAAFYGVAATKWTMEG